MLEAIEPATKAKARGQEGDQRRGAQRQGRRAPRRPVRRRRPRSRSRASIEQGADPEKVAEAFQIAADQVEEGEDEGDKFKATEFKKALLFRAARIYESTLEDAAKRAEDVYATLVELDPEDEIAFTALEELRQAARQARGARRDAPRPEREEREPQRARARAEPDRAPLPRASSTTRSRPPSRSPRRSGRRRRTTRYAVDLERAAGSDMKLWTEALAGAVAA